jgi:alpha-galactosidase/6-phospho-beta-glucosidase family protein
MYDFHYNYIRKKFQDVKLLFTDTDSLMYYIKTEDFYEDIKKDVDEWFDNSEYPKEHKCYNENNKKVIGKFKDEAGSKIIEEFVGLRSKLYSYKMFGEIDGHKKCKGIKKAVVKKEITHEDYKECLFGRKEQMRKMCVLRSHRHDIYSEEINKVALSADDDKRIIREDGIHTYAHGHYSSQAIL